MLGVATVLGPLVGRYAQRHHLTGFAFPIR